MSERDLPVDEAERARQLLERFHELGDWAAGEIVERHRRDNERLASGYHDLKPRLTVHEMFVRRYVKRHRGSTVEDISMGVSLEVAEVLALTEQLCDRGILVFSDHGEAALTECQRGSSLSRVRRPGGIGIDALA